MVDTLVSGASASRRVGSTPISGTINGDDNNVIPIFLCHFGLFWQVNCCLSGFCENCVPSKGSTQFS